MPVTSDPVKQESSSVAGVFAAPPPGGSARGTKVDQAFVDQAEGPVDQEGIW